MVWYGNGFESHPEKFVGAKTTSEIHARILVFAKILLLKIKSIYNTAFFYKKGVCPFFEKSLKSINLFILMKNVLFLKISSPE